MRAALLVVAVALAVVALAAVSQSSASTTPSAVVASIYDGDTLTLANGQRVRLLQIDTPELGSGECYSRAARTGLLNLAPVGSRIALETDPVLDKVDRYGRLLRYVKRNGVNVNVELVRRGAAAPYFYRGERGRFASGLMSSALTAKAAKRGLWKACPDTKLDPNRAVDTGKSGPPASNPPPSATPSPPASNPPPSGKCDPNYSGGCVPLYPPDVDCADIRALGIAPVRVIGVDVHRLDGDHDGWGCE